MRADYRLANSCRGMWAWLWLCTCIWHSQLVFGATCAHALSFNPQHDHQCPVRQSHSTPALISPPVLVQPMMLHATVISGLKFDKFLQVSKAQSPAQRFASRRAWRQRQASSGPRTFRHRRISRARDSIHRARRRTNPSSQQRQWRKHERLLDANEKETEICQQRE